MEPRGDFGQNFEVENALQWAAEVHQQQPITYCHEHTGNELQYPAPAAAILQPIDGPRDISLNLPPQSNNAVPPVVSQLENQSPEDTKFVKLLDAYTFSTSLEPLIAKNKPTFVKFVKIVNAHIKYQEDTWRSHLGHLETVQRVYSGSSNDEETLDDFSGLNQERFQPYRRGYPRGRSMSKVRGSSRLSGRSSRSSSVQNHGRVVLDKKMIDILFGGFENRVEVEKKIERLIQPGAYLHGHCFKYVRDRWVRFVNNELNEENMAADEHYYDAGGDDDLLTDDAHQDKENLGGQEKEGNS